MTVTVTLNGKMSAESIATRAGCSVAHVYNRIKERKLKAQKLGPKQEWYADAEEVERAIAAGLLKGRGVRRIPVERKEVEVMPDTQKTPIALAYDTDRFRFIEVVLRARGKTLAGFVLESLDEFYRRANALLEPVCPNPPAKIEHNFAQSVVDSPGQA